MCEFDGTASFAGEFQLGINAIAEKQGRSTLEVVGDMSTVY